MTIIRDSSIGSGSSIVVVGVVDTMQAAIHKDKNQINVLTSNSNIEDYVKDC